MRNHALITVLVVLSAATVALNWPRHEVLYTPKPSLTAAQTAALPDDQLVERVTADLRQRLGYDPRVMEQWRELPAPARHLLALQLVQRDDRLSELPVFHGFASLTQRVEPTTPTLGEISDAYTAIGAPQAAAAVATADSIFRSLPPGVRPTHALFEGPDRRFRDAVQQEKTIKLLRAYVRAHGDEIAEIAPVR